MNIKKRRDEEKRLKRIIAETKDAIEEDAHPDKTGVLLSDEIEFYVEKVQLISPFDPDNLKPAAYELTVGDEAMVGGEFRSLSDNPKDKDNVLRIPPFDVAVIKTGETLNLPRFLIGRWNIRTRWAYKGLVWVGGPQVDPGYVGHLFCPIYNLSNKEFLLRKGEPIAVFDFVKTTSFDAESADKEKLLRYRRPPNRLIMEEYDIDDFGSGPFETKDELERVERKVDLFTPFVFVILAILMAAIGLPYVTGSKTIQPEIPLLDGLTLCFSLFAAILSLLNWISRPKRKTWILLLSIALAIGATITLYFVSTM